MNLLNLVAAFDERGIRREFKQRLNCPAGAPDAESLEQFRQGEQKHNRRCFRPFADASRANYSDRHQHIHIKREVAQGANRLWKNKPTTGEYGNQGGGNFSVRREKILPLEQE